MPERRLYSTEFTPDVNPPDDLLHFYGLLDRIIRYQVEYYPKGLFIDQSVGYHSRRMVTFWDRLDLPEECDSEAGRRMLWTHDIAEIKVGDVSATELARNPAFARRREARELVAARQLLKESDYNLCFRFENGKSFWKGGEQNSDYTAYAVRVVDIIDGNVVFNERMSRYCYEHGVGDLDPKMRTAINYAYIQQKMLRRQLDLLPSNLREWFEGMVVLHLNYILACWEDVPKTNTPQAVREKILLYSQKR